MAPEKIHRLYWTGHRAKSTHDFRVSAARICYKCKVPQNKINMLARWSANTFIEHYLAGYPDLAMLCLAGFRHQMGAALFPRALMEPPEGLMTGFFIDELKTKLASRSGDEISNISASTICKAIRSDLGYSRKVLEKRSR